MALLEANPTRQAMTLPLDAAVGVTPPRCDSEVLLATGGCRSPSRVRDSSQPPPFVMNQPAQNQSSTSATQIGGA